MTALVLIISLVITVFGWVGYAYFQPHTWSGQLLIKVDKEKIVNLNLLVVQHILVSMLTPNIS